MIIKEVFSFLATLIFFFTCWLSRFNASYKNVDVCVIIPQFDFIDFRSTRKFSDQVVRFKFLDHKNIVKVLGLTTDLEDTLIIVTGK